MGLRPGGGDVYCDDVDRLERLRAMAAETERKLLENADELAARGMDVEGELKRLRADLQRIEAQHAEADDAYEKMLQSLADLADARRELYGALQLLVGAAEAKYPATPETIRARLLLEKLRKEMPRD
jgi:predicted nuclease with TOPRIM domain